MGILRADVISHSPIEGDAEGSIVLDGTGDYLTFGTSPDFTMGTGDFTVEFWYYLTTFDASSGNYYFFDSGTNKIRIQFYNGNLYFGDDSVTNYGAIGQTLNTWYHVAGVRKSGVRELFLNGVSQGTTATTKNNTGDDFTIANHGGGGSSGDYEPYGYMSNFRLVKGKAVYTENFVVPRFPLKNIPGTVLLGLQSSGEVDFSVKPSAVTVHGNAAAASLSPLKKDKSDVGIVFGDNTKFDTLSYMVPPGGTTTQRGRGRGVLGGGAPFVSPNVISNMQYIEIQSGGIFKDFGDLTVARGYFPAGQTASSTRGLSAGGWTGSDNNTIDYITIATTSNATEFGDTSVVRPSGGLSNQTRSVNGGDAALTNTIDYVTIATTGNASDFGDLTEGRGYVAGVASPTRGVFGGGRNNTPSSNTLKNTMEYITIATTGNTTDFGDLQALRYGHTGFSSSVRGIWAGGYAAPGQTKLIDYFTIATLGNSADFGDLSTNNGYCASVTNSIRGAVTINDAPNYYNTIEYITIATTGNAKDFGDSDPTGSGKGHGDFPSSMSDSHGGIS